MRNIAIRDAHRIMRQANADAPGARHRPRFHIPTDLPLCVMLLIFTLPILWMILLSIEPDRVIITPSWNFDFTLDNITALWAPDQPYMTQMLNSVVIVLGTMALCGSVALLTGYSLAKLHISRWLSIPVLAACAVLPLTPPMTLVPGFYVTLAQIGLLGTLPGLIVLNTVLNLPFATLLMKLAIDEVPTSLREAAIIDGAGDGRVLLQIILPVAAPALVAACLFTAIMTWNEFLMGLTMTAGGTTAPLTVGIASMVQPYDIHWGRMAAAGSLAVLPILLISVAANRHIVAGLTRGAVKG